MSWDDDDVGYGRRPKWTRFKKGKSGNETGRPRHEVVEPKPQPTKSEQDDALREALNKEIEIAEGGKRVKMKVGHAAQSIFEERVQLRDAVQEALLPRLAFGSNRFINDTGKPSGDRGLYHEFLQGNHRTALRIAAQGTDCRC